MHEVGTHMHEKLQLPEFLLHFYPLSSVGHSFGIGKGLNTGLALLAGPVEIPQLVYWKPVAPPPPPPPNTKMYP